MTKSCTINRMITTAAAFFMAVSIGAGAQAAYKEVSYTKVIQPIFDTFCVDCHLPGGDGYQSSGLDLRTYEGIMKGTRFGKVIVPGDSFTSNLMAVLEGRTDASISMPHAKKREMTKADRRVLRKWIVNGATEAGYEEGPEEVISDLCLHCHIPGGSGYEKSGLDMRSYDMLMKGTKFGPVVVPGDSFSSNLLVLIEGRASGGLKMPHNAVGSPSSKDKINLRRWINQGAKNN